MINTELFQALKREKELTEMLDYLTYRASRKFLEDQFYQVTEMLKLARNREQVFIENNISEWLGKAKQ